MVIIAAYNEEKGIGPTIAELKQYLGEPRFLVVDGNSQDQTVDVAKKLYADVLFQKGRGKGDAIANGLRFVKENYEYLVLTDADYTYPAEHIPHMIKILEENPHVGMVCGNRFNSHLHLSAMGNIYYFGNRFLAFTHNLFNGVGLQDPLTGLRVIRWNIIKDWQPKSESFDIEVELNYYIERQGYKIAELEIPYRERVGEKKLKLSDGMIILRRILTESIHNLIP